MNSSIVENNFNNSFQVFTLGEENSQFIKDGKDKRASIPKMVAFVKFV